MHTRQMFGGPVALPMSGWILCVRMFGSFTDRHGVDGTRLNRRTSCNRRSFDFGRTVEFGSSFNKSQLFAPGTLFARGTASRHRSRWRQVTSRVSRCVCLQVYPQTFENLTDPMLRVLFTLQYGSISLMLLASTISSPGTPFSFPRLYRSSRRATSDRSTATISFPT